MPVGTKGTVKTLHPDEVRDLGAQILLGNTYHLHFRPGRRARSATSAGCTASWRGTGRSSPTPAGSRSSRCATRSRASTTKGSRSATSTTAPPLASPPSSRSDPAEPRQRHRDVPRPGAARGRPATAARGRGAPHDRVGRPPASRCRAPRASCASRSPRAASTRELRRRSIEEIAELDFDGNAIGGLAIGEDREVMFETTDWVAALLPADKPRYFMGIGDPEGILEVIEAGIDMFDCVLPTRTARTGSALTARRPAQPPQRALRARRGPARGGVRLPRLRALLPGLHPPPREPERAARPAPALAPQSTLPRAAHPTAPARRSSAVRSPRTSATDCES